MNIWMSNDREPDDDALLLAMFASADRPAHSDPAFVGSVMQRVDGEAARGKAWRSAAIPAAVALGIGAFWPFLGPIGALIGQAAMPVLHAAPGVGAGGLSMILAFAAAGGAWLYAERT